MTTYIYGTDTYRIKEYLRTHAPGALVGEEALKSQGLFGQAPVILYDVPDKLKIPEDVEVFVITPKKLKKGIELNPLKGNDITTWIREQVTAAGFTLSPDALAALSARYTDSWQTKLAIDTLLNYTHAKKKIEASDLAILLQEAVLDSVFKLTDAIANNQKREALLLLDRQLASGAEVYYLFTMVVFQFRNMLAPDRAGVHPFAAGKARSAAKRFTPAALKRAYRSLQDLEFAAKTGQRDMAEGLFHLICTLDAQAT